MLLRIKNSQELLINNFASGLAIESSRKLIIDGKKVKK